MEPLLEKLEQLPPLPDVCLKLGELIEDPRCTAQSMAGLIERDTALAANLLKVANSAFYAVPGGIKSVQRAVTTLGFSAVHQFALCTLSTGVLKRQGRGVGPELAAHNQAVSVLALRLANALRVPGREMALAAGLLHDVGRLAAQVLSPERIERYEAALAGGATHGLELEREVLGADHLELASRLAMHWHYPAALKAAIEQHHDRPGQSLDGAPSIADVVAVADAWAHALGVPSMKGGAAIPLAAERFQRLGVAPAPAEGERPQLLELISHASQL